MTKEACNISIFIDKIFIYAIIFIFLFADPTNKYLQYSNLGISLIYFFLNVLIRKIKMKFISKSILFFPILLILCWIYGVVLGLFYGNDFVFVNNIGILFFTTFYFFSITTLKPLDFFKIFFYSSIVSILSYFYSIPNLYSSLYIFFINFVVGDRFSYNILGIFPFLLFPIIVYNIFFNRVQNLLIKSTFINFILFFVLLFIAFFLVASKGIYLFIIGVFLSLFLTNFKNFKLIYYILIFITIFFLVNNFDQITIFGNQDVSNENRYKQFDAVISELTIFGKGWGAKFVSNDLDRDENGYSIELSYLNLIHKIGFLSILFFIFYLFNFLKIFQLLKSDKVRLKETGLLCLGLTCYLFTSLGNPSLFAPIFVFLNCILLIIINKSLIYDRQ
jgi:hypothetical protein